MSSALAMPMLMLNMGGEMLYILQQRLDAQSVNFEKSSRVLGDVTNALFTTKFMEEVFTSRTISSAGAIRGIFDTLAHASIMRLNTSSMDKLYDLVTMGFKQQLLAIHHPYDMLACTLNHIDEIKLMVHGNNELIVQIDMYVRKFTSLFLKHSAASLQRVRQVLLRFLQDRRVKISVFLTAGLQTAFGAMVIRHDGYLGIGSDVPGLIRYFESTSTICSCLSKHYNRLPCSGSYSSSCSTSYNNEAIGGEVISKVTLISSKLPHTDVVLPLPPNGVSILDPKRPCRLGLNVYIQKVSDTDTPLPPEPQTEKEDEVPPEPQYSIEYMEDGALLALLNSLPEIQQKNEKTFILSGLVDGDDGEEWHQDKVFNMKGDDADERARKLLGHTDDNNEDMVDLLALMDMAEDM